MSHLNIKKEDVLLALGEIRQHKFNENISRVLGQDMVIGEMHYGNSHTTEPRQ
jgi:hypothetical protein